MENFGIFFSQDENWPVLLSLPVLIFLYWKTRRHRIQIMRDIQKKQVSNLLSESSMMAPKLRPFKIVLYLLGTLFLCLAYLGPQWGQKEKTFKAEGLDVCFALDLSRSMLAEDVSPSRLEQAKNQLSIFLPNLGGDRAAIVGFAGTGFVAAPLSADHNALSGFLDPLDPSFISNQSTRLGAGVSACLSALGLEGIKNREEIAGTSAKLIVLISDGEDQFEDYNSSIQTCEKLGIPIFTMAAGTVKGGKIPVRDNRGEIKSYVMDQKEAVVTQLKDKALKEISQKTGAKTFYLSSGTTAWKQFSEATENYKRDSIDAGTKLDREERFQWPLLIAFVLLLIDFFLPESKIHFPLLRRIFRKKSTQSIGIILICVFTGHSTFAQDKKVKEKMLADPEIVLDNNRALSKLHKNDLQGSLKDLEKGLEKNAGHPILRFNYATTKMYSALNKDGSVNPKVMDETIKELEALKRDTENAKSPELQDLSKAIHYQLGHAYELIKDLDKALDSYYRTFNTGRVNADGLDTKAKNNISRLITQKQSAGGGGGGGSDDSQQKSEGGEGDQKNSNADNGKEPDKSPKQDGSDHTDKKVQPKYSGTDIGEGEARQILESVKGEEREVQKRKAKGEAKARASKDAKEQGFSNSEGSQW